MGADEEYVTSRWEWYEVRLAEPFEGIKQGKWTARLPFMPFSQVAFNDEAAAHAAARAFTEQREEEIRQLEAQAAWLKPYIRSIKLAIDSAYELRAPDNLADDQRECEIVLGILARAEAALADKKRGMKQPPEQGRGEGR